MLTLNDGRSELWQWDTGRTLTVDAECSQVHFSNKVFGRSIDADVLDGVAIIPDVLLQTDKDFTAWAFVGTAENGYTKISKVFKVNKRNKPADYVFTLPEQTTLEEILKKIDHLESIQDPDAIKNAVDEYLANNPIQIDEKDPTVPDWAKQSVKPKYTAKEIGAVATVNGIAPDENGNVEITIPDSGGNVDLTGYATEQWVKDQNYLTEVPEGYAKDEDIPTKPEDIGAQPSGDYALKSEIPSVPVQSVNGKTGAVQLSAADVKARPDNWMPTAQEVGALPSSYTPPNQTAEQVGADPKGTAASAVSQHNTAVDTHNDIRMELKAINDRLNAFFDSDNQTLDELSEIVAYITSNKSLIDSITTSKVSISDIINNLTTNVSNKPLSAAQGVVLKGLIDTLSGSLANYQPKGDYALRSELPAVPTKVSAFTNDAEYLTGQMTSENEVPVLGSELASANNWTTTGWTGDFSSGFTHTSGNTNALSFAIPGIAVGKAYVIEFDCSVDYTNTNLLVTIGAAPAMLLYGLGRTNTKVGVIAVDTGALTFTPESAFVGKISNISVREIMAVSIPRQTIKGSDGAVISETRNIGENLFIGNGVGGMTVPGTAGNYAIGDEETFQNNISGFWNVAIGKDCMKGNVSGSRNVSIGANNLRENVTGTRNVSIGNFTMAQTKNPNRTVAIGGDCMSTATGSENNVAIGFQSMYKNTTGNKNVAIGDVAGFANTTGAYNAFVGADAGSGNTTGGYNVAVGGRALPANTTGSNNVAIGYTAMYKSTNGAYNVAIGMAALKGVSGTTGVKNNVAIGNDALVGAKTVTNTVAIGQGAGESLATGDSNIIIGRGCDLPDGTTYGLNIGDLLKGSTKPGSAYLDINGGLRVSSIPTGYPNIDTAVWNNGGVLMVGNGGMDTIVQAVIAALPVYNGEVE